MARVTIIIGYLVSICILACLLAYPIYLATDADFERIVSRTILVNAVILFYPLCCLLKIHHPSDLGFIKANPITSITNSVVIGFLMLAPISMFFIYCEYRYWEPNAAALLPLVIALFSALASGLIIGLIEETLFRGVIQSQLSKVFNVVLVIAIVNIIYASVHFLQAPDSTATLQIHWYTGFIILREAFANLANYELYADAWLALLLAGIFLSMIKLRSNNLWWCIGIHAGWVTHIKLFKDLTNRSQDAECAYLASSYDNYIGELSTIWILIVLTFWFFYNRKTNAQ